MKRIFAVLLIAALVLTIGVAFAAPISLKGLNEAKLYELYSEVSSQLQLLQLRKAANYVPLSNYDDIERNPSNHTGESLYFEGKVIQVVEGSLNTYRIAANGKNDQIFLVTYTLPENTERFLEDDKVCVYAKFTELYTYKSTMNQSVTVPRCEAALIIHPVTNNNVKGASQEELETALADIREQLSKTAAKDKDHIKLTKKNYDFYAKNPGLYKDQKISFSGKTLQVLDGTSFSAIRVAVDSDSDKVIYLTLPNELMTIRVLEDDVINVKGTFTGLYTYESAKGGDITIPACTAEAVDVKGYKAPGKVAKDKDGNSKLTKKTLDDYFRRPNEHTDEQIAFSAKVVQVIEGPDSSEYRMAIDNDYNAMIYVILPNDYKTMRVLEDDKVNVVATFNGLLTYESTFGSAVTVPKCTASSVVIPGKKATVATKDASGQYKVSKKNYEMFARDEATYKGQTLTFSAKVVQVVDDDSYTTYRLAVDKDLNCIFLGVIMNSDLDVRILEDDIVDVEASSTGLFSYNSTMGGVITIPSCLISKYSIQNYKKIDLGSTDANGNYTITKKNYTEIARNPDPYKLKGMTFKGKVIQAMEGSSSNSYRISVDSDSNCVIYVEFALPAGSPRILEKDKVTVTGTYYGIYSYQTIMGNTVSVPAVLATEIKR